MYKYLIYLLIFLIGCGQVPSNQNKNDPGSSNPLKPEIKARAQFDQKLETIPFYRAIRSEYVDGSFKEAFEMAINGKNTQLIENMSNNVLYLLGKPFGNTFGKKPLNKAIETDNKNAFDAILQNYKKLYLFHQDQHGALERAAQLTDLTSSEYFLNQMLDKKFQPSSSLKGFVKDSKLKERIIDIESYNIGPDGRKSKLQGLIAGCKLDEIKSFLKDQKAVIDWTGGAQNDSTPLCFASTYNLSCSDDERFSIVKTLLANGANPNCGITDNPISNLYLRYQKDEPRFKQYWNLFKAHGANPFIPTGRGFLAERLSLKSQYKAQVLEIEEEYPHVLKELSLRRNIATIKGQKFDTDIFGTRVELNGGNFQAAIYKLLLEYLDDFKDQPSGFMGELLDTLKKSINLSLEILGSGNPQTLSQTIHKSSQEFPVIIPAGWPGHATAIVIYKDLFIKLNKGDRSDGIISGARFYGFSSSKENISKLMPLIKFEKDEEKEIIAGILMNLFDKTIDGEMSLHFIDQREENNQCVDNCTWESSASFALKLASAILLVDNYEQKNANELTKAILEKSYEEAEERNDAFKRFAAYNIVKKYIEHTKNALDSNKCLPATDILANILRVEAAQAQRANNEDTYQQKTIEAILTSGLPLAVSSEFYIYSKENAKPLKYLLKKLQISVDDDFLARDQPSPKDSETANKFFDIYEPKNTKGEKNYPWGKCFY